MTLTLDVPTPSEMKPKIVVFGVGGAGGNVVNNMIEANLDGVEFVVANTDSQALQKSNAERKIQIGAAVTEGLGAGSNPQIGKAAAEETQDEIKDHLSPAHMVFVTLGMGGGTGTGAGPVIAKIARDMGILTVGVVTKPFEFEGQKREKVAEKGIREFAENVDTLIIIPNQNLFKLADDKTKFTDAFAMADKVLQEGVASITELMTKEGLINLDFADVRAIMGEMGRAMMGTGEAIGENRAIEAAQAAISNPLLDETSMGRAKGLLISITGDPNLTLFEVDEAVRRIRKEVSEDANIIVGAAHDENLENMMRVSVVATGIHAEEDNETIYHNTQIQDNHITPFQNQIRQTDKITDNIQTNLQNIPVETKQSEIQNENAINQNHQDQYDHQTDNAGIFQEKNDLNTSNQDQIRQKTKRLPEIKDFPPIAQMEIAAKKNNQEQQKQNQQTHINHNDANTLNNPNAQTETQAYSEKYQQQNINQKKEAVQEKYNPSILQRFGFGTKKQSKKQPQQPENYEQKSLMPKLPPINENKKIPNSKNEYQNAKHVQNHHQDNAYEQDNTYEDDLEIPTFLRKHGG